MSVRCILATEGFQAIFHLKPLDKELESFDAAIDLILDPDLGAIAMRSIPTFLSLHDCRRLLVYMEEHIWGLRHDATKESPVYVPLEMGFQIRALAGEVNADDEGEFGLRFMLNVGQKEGFSPVYVGAESVIDVEDARRFATSLDTVLAELAPSS